MQWADVADTVGKAAPALGGVLAGPAGASIGTLIAKALGVEENPQAVASAVQQDPQAAVKLREVEASLSKAMMRHQADVITAEAKGESWLQRNWRPLMMLWFGVLVGGYWFGVTPDNLSEPTVLALFDIVQLGIGGYIVGRSAEKITKTATGTGLMGKVLKR